MRRTLFTIIIALLGVTGAWAKETTHTVNNLIYTVVQPGTGENYAILSGYENSPEGILDIPGIIPVYFGVKPLKIPVTMIGEQAFIDREKITQVNIPSSIKSIGNLAFNGCISLTSFNVNSKNANFCSENGILFNKDKTTLLQYPSAKADTGYSIPDGVTKIEDWAFYDCNKLTVMTIPSSVATIGEYALNFCTGLTELFVHATTPPTVGTNAFTNVDRAIPVYVPAASLDAYKAAAGWKDFTNLQALVTEFTVNNLKYKVTDNTANEVELTGYTTKPTGKLYIPTNLTYGSKTYLVTGIKNDAFYGCSEITEVTIPTCVKSIGQRAFYECTSLGNLKIVNGVTSIGDQAFCKCSALTKVTIPESVTSLGQLVFAECSSLTQATIGSGVTEIRFGLFGGCTALEKVVIGKGVTEIGNVAFANCSKIKEMTVQATVPPTVEYAQSLGTISRDIPVYVPAESLDAYKEANRWKEFTKLQALVTEFTVDNLKYKVTDYIADEVELTGYATEPTGKLDIPASVTYGSKTYRVTSIGFQAFYKCSTLTRVTIPASVTSVDAAVFGMCSSLTQATIGDGVKRINASMFSGCSALEKLVIGKAVTYIDLYAFKNCSNLKEITVLASNPPFVPQVEVFENVSRDIPVYVPAASLAAYQAASIWQDFTKLQALVTEFTVDNLKYKITDYIADEVELTGYTTKPTGKLDIPASVTYGSKTYSVTSIVEQAFSGCSEITEVTIPASVTSVGSGVFNGCSSLTQATIGDGLTEISTFMFTNCSALEKLVIGKGVTKIGSYAFANCSNLKEITVLASNPPSVASDRTFENVSRDIPVYVPLESLSAYQTADVWKEFTNLQAIAGTAIDTPSMPESISIQGGMLHNPQQLPVIIYGLTGRPVYSGNATTVELPAGMYIVSCNGASCKAVF